MISRIGIITKHSVPNYGAMLQAYGLAACLNQRLGVSAELVDYDQPATTRLFRPKLGIPIYINNWRRYFNCKLFVRRHQTLSNYHCTSVDTFLPHKDNYDALITGSDQVWFTGPVQYYDPMYFLDFPAEGIRKISYAPSAGGINDFGEFKDRVKNALNDFSSLSVRDDNTERLLNEMGYCPRRVVDPTILHDFLDLADTKKRPLKEPYLLIFGNLSKQAQRATARKAKELGLKRIVTLQYHCAIATDRIPAPSPIDWLTYFYHAAFVVTAYFHGTVFAVKFKKPFVAIPTKGRVKKVSSLLKDFNLTPQLVIEGESSAESERIAFEAAIDWDGAREAIALRAEDSINYLREAIGCTEPATNRFDSIPTTP